MQLSNAPLKFVLPFASSGGKTIIPVTTGVAPNNATLVDGFPPPTRLPIGSGGIPPDGLDMNGILYETTAIARWANAGAGYLWDSSFASDSNVNGYPKGAKVLMSDFNGYWLNTIDNNTTNPETFGAGWIPGESVGISAISMTSSNVTLSALEAAKPIIRITGTLTANLQLIFPATYQKSWTVINYCTGAFSITLKTAAGAGVSIPVNSTLAVSSDGSDIVLSSSSSGGNTTISNQFVNRIMNGDMVIDQRNSGSAITPTSTAYTVDGWKADLNNASRLTFQQVSDAPNGFSKSLKITVASLNNPAGGTFFNLSQPIEGYNVSDLAFGTPSAKSISISFFVKGSVAGNYSLAIRNGALNRSYVNDFAVTTSWNKVSITIPGDIIGTWEVGNLAGLIATIDLGSGASFQGTANAWTSSNITRTSTSTTFVNTAVGATLNFTGFQIEKGIVPTDFSIRPFNYELAMCQRYYYQINGALGILNYQGYHAAGGTATLGVLLPVPMRATPTLGGSPVWSTINCSGVQVVTPSNPIGIYTSATVTALGAFNYFLTSGSVTLSAAL
jgi:hypothetical protein